MSARFHNPSRGEIKLGHEGCNARYVGKDPEYMRHYGTIARVFHDFEGTLRVSIKLHRCSSSNQIENHNASDWCIYDYNNKLGHEYYNEYNAHGFSLREQKQQNPGLFNGVDKNTINDIATAAQQAVANNLTKERACLLYTSPSPRDGATSRMPSSA